MELAALECLKNSSETYNEINVVSTLVLSFFEWISIILAGNKDNYKSLNEFKFQPNPITNY